MIAGAVAVVYVLGGLIFALRLMLDGSSVGEAVALVGQLSREFLITAGMIEAVGLAGLVGLAAGLIMGGARLPRKPESAASAPSHGKAWPNLRYWIGGWLPTLILLIGVAALLVTPAAVLLFQEDDQSGLEWGVLVSALAVSYGLAALCWYALRTVAAERPHRRGRAIAGGLIWMGMALPGAIVLSSFINLEQARVCVVGQDDPVTGTLVADTSEAVLLTHTLGEKGTEAGLSKEDETVIRIPAERVVRLDYGAPPHLLPDCPKRRSDGIRVKASSRHGLPAQLAGVPAVLPD